MQRDGAYNKLRIWIFNLRFTRVLQYFIASLFELFPFRAFKKSEFLKLSIKFGREHYRFLMTFSNGSYKSYTWWYATRLPMVVARVLNRKDNSFTSTLLLNQTKFIITLFSTYVYKMSYLSIHFSSSPVTEGGVSSWRVPTKRPCSTFMTHHLQHAPFHIGGLMPIISLLDMQVGDRRTSFTHLTLQPVGD